MAPTVEPPDYSEYLDWIKTTPAPDTEIEFFRSNPSTKSFLDDQQFTAIPTPTFLLREGHSDNAFIASTMRTPEGIRHWLMLMRKDFTTPPDSSKGSIALPPGLQSLSARETKKTDFIALMEVGRDLDGFGGRTHGGALCALFDEILSLCVEYHRQATVESRVPLYTVQLNVSYRGAVDSPGIVVVKTWLEAREGRKWWLRGQLCDTQDRVLTQAEGIWMTPKESVL